MGVKIALAKASEKAPLLDFLVSTNGEDLRELASGYVSAMFSSDFRKPQFLVAKKDDTIIGSAAFSEELFTTRTWGISWVGVQEAERNQGVGQALVEACCDEIRKAAQQTVTVLLGTYPNQTGLYNRSGFEKLGQDHEGGWFMKKTLES